ncbi:hypothetical protein [Sphingomonas sp. Leaf10]|uniref:hypothetical protein n=1 Tax=Sphingomonas sp. Leaf10 TaxID=1735676 RepID=UPI0006F39C3C|nr:hypothetical protein [Sphingomonas sp. Leaf10]KQM41224.1 hypothetical protein ASE59_02785 [Sphingomonas sp. Leaf10]
MADRAFSADAPRASLENDLSAKSTRRDVLGKMALVPVLALTPTPWTTPFDPAAWLERWYRLGNMVGPSDKGEPMLWTNMDGDEAASDALRLELEYLGNRVRMRRYLRTFLPARPGTFTSYAGRRS